MLLLQLLRLKFHIFIVVIGKCTMSLVLSVRVLFASKPGIIIGGILCAERFGLTSDCFSLQHQYIFIHNALLEVVRLGMTDIYAQNLHSCYSVLMAKAFASNKTRMEEEFAVRPLV